MHVWEKECTMKNQLSVLCIAFLIFGLVSLPFLPFGSASTGWSKTYGGAGDDEAMCVIQTDDGGYAVAGYTNSSGVGGFDAWLVKTDAYGNVQWDKTYGGTGIDKAFKVIQTNDGG